TLDVRVVMGPVEGSRVLSMRASDVVVNLRRLLSFDQVPTILDDIWLPGAAFKGLTAESLARYRGPLYALFESEFGVSMVRAEEKIKAVAVSDEQAGLLNIASGSPVLQVERVSFTYCDRPMELRRCLYLTDRF